MKILIAFLFSFNVYATSCIPPKLLTQLHENQEIINYKEIQSLLGPHIDNSCTAKKELKDLIIELDHELYNKDSARIIRILWEILKPTPAEAPTHDGRGNR